MELKINPRITGGFVHKIMRESDVKKHTDALNISEEDCHNLVKAILISGFTHYKFDFKKQIEIIRSE